ncbi:MAG: VanW family protein [Nocardioides sp.]|uniref:VanW family protein n=1 Tax=Nocardioides sp. TaxID=35761 RepID=UPI0039E68F72
MGDLFSDDADDDDTAVRPPLDLSDDDGAKPRRGRAVGAFLAVVLGLVAIVGGGWAAAYAFADGKLPQHTSVAGVQLGNLTRAAAERKLADELGTPAAFTVTVGSKKAKVDPATSGVALDVAATVDQAGVGDTWDPRDLWNHYTSGSEVEPVFTVDDTTLDAVVAKVNEAVGTAKKDGAVTFGTDGVQTTAAVVGKGVAKDDLLSAIEAAIAGAGAQTVELEVGDDVPDIDDSDVQSAVTDVANPAMSGPVTLQFGNSPVVLQPQDYASALSMKAENGALALAVDATAFDALLQDRTAGRDDAPVDATVVLKNGKPRVVAAKPGVSYDPAQALSVFQSLLTASGAGRTGTIEATVAEPEISTAEAESWGIKEKVSSFTTYFPYAEYRNTNIGRAAEIVNGTILKPGETFSLNGVVGERTRENGFTEGWTIQDGVFKADLGGGVSQMATTTFNAMFFAGLQDVEHKPHSLYISRYPVGREATVAWGSVDLKFKNDTKYGVLIRSVVTPSTPSSQGVVTVSMWSTKVWDITTTTSARYASTPFKKRKISGGNCETTVGANGFQVDVKRYFHHVGEKAVAKTENFHTTYIPQDQVTCTGTTKSPS